MTNPHVLTYCSYHRGHVFQFIDYFKLFQVLFVFIWFTHIFDCQTSCLCDYLFLPDVLRLHPLVFPLSCAYILPYFPVFSARFSSSCVSCPPVFLLTLSSSHVLKILGCLCDHAFLPDSEKSCSLFGE